MKTKIYLNNFIKILILLLIVVSCRYGQDYRYEWKVKVTYDNADIDTLDVSRDSFKGNICYIGLKIYEGGALSDAGVTPSLVTGCGAFYQTTIVTGVRKFEILESDTIPIP